MTQYDAVIVGAGIIGLATAYHIKLEDRSKNVLVVDKFPAAGQFSTARSASAYRYLFTSGINFDLVESTMECLKDIQKKGTNLGINQAGYLWLFSEKRYKELEPVFAEMGKRGLITQPFEPTDLTEMLKLQTDLSGDEEAQMMGLKNVYKGIFIPNAGFLDVELLVKFYEDEFRKLDGKIQYNTTVDDIKIETINSMKTPDEPYFWQNSRVAGVQTSRMIDKNITHEEILAKTTIIATGALTSPFLSKLGFFPSVAAKKRQIHSIKATTKELEELLFVQKFNQKDCKSRCMPFTILPDGTYLRPVIEEKAFWACHSDTFTRPFKVEDDPQAEENYYTYGVYQVLRKYLPQFNEAKPFAAFAGLYEYTQDKQPVIFKSHDFLVVAGASGSGIMKCDAIGRIAAALHNNQDEATLYGGKTFKVSDLGIDNRNVEVEKMII